MNNLWSEPGKKGRTGDGEKWSGGIVNWLIGKSEPGLNLELGTRDK